MTTAVAYYRVSTARQGASGLGLDAQRKAVEDLCAAKGWELIAPPFQEVESGKRSDRPQLLKAIERAKLTGSKLVIAKLDRLSRNASFLLALKDSGIEFVAADMPDANNLTVGIMALVAQQEREAISRRTTEALAAAKARGTKLGNPNGATVLRRYAGASAMGTAAKVDIADRFAESIRGTVEQLRADGRTSLAAIAEGLNEQSIRTPTGKGKWHPSSVRNLLARLG
jgi:DNA invertase Pin-like site-specific DNA recombinase